MKKKGKSKKGKKTKASFSRGRGKSSMGASCPEPVDPEPTEEELDQLLGEEMAAPKPKLDQELMLSKHMFCGVMVDNVDMSNCALFWYGYVLWNMFP